jgi:hypothetical protein
MPTIVAEGKVLVSVAQKAAKVIKWAEVSRKARAQLNRSIEQANLDAIQVCYSVCKAFVAYAIGAEPSTDQVNEHMAKAVDDPAFPNRAYRLFGEVQKSASQRRRIFLASMLFGLPSGKMPDDERDRVDMAVERMMPADVEFLSILSEKRKVAGQSPMASVGQIFGPSGIVALVQGTDLRIATPDERLGQFSNDLFNNPAFIGDRAALASLQSLGCVELSQSVMSHARWRVHHLIVTPLGDTVLRALEEVRPGLEAQVLSRSKRRRR